MKKPSVLFLVISLCLASAACDRAAPPTASERAKQASDKAEPAQQGWPRIESAIRPDEPIEKRIAEILKGLTLRQKVGQMTQAEIRFVTPEDVRTHYLGSVLNGGGSWPDKDRRASANDWVALADKFHDASMSTDMAVKIPVIWGTDAVHGHGNVRGATLYPHNIGLGAARDPALVGRIAAATGKAVRATGIDWLFAPAVPVVQDARWGRTYESYSDDPALVREYAAAYTKALQGSFGDDANAIASVKHFLGDGGTEHGKDQGVTRATLQQLIDVHGAGYYGAVGAGAQTVMASYNSWVDAGSGQDHGKLHGIRSLLTGALKEKIGFDGFIVSDWNAIGQIPGCTNASCPAAINAGIDMVMVPEDWKAFIDNTVAQVEAGEIPMARIDDAVTRILRVKLRAGLFDDKKPSQHAHAGNPGALQDRALAREAVRKSIVLLKNEKSALPLARGKKILVVGASADSIPNQAGGWSTTWQGTETTNGDYPNADSLLAGIREAAGAGNVTYNAKADGVDVSQFDAVIAVLGETPYAEYNGDILPTDTVSHGRRFPDDLAALRAVSGRGKPVVTVLLSGRPLYANDLINLSDAFVAAFLPGTEGKGVSDVLFAGADGKPAHDFSAALSFPWPAVACPGPQATGANGAKPQFARGYGLTYAKPAVVAQLPLDDAKNCGEPATLAIFEQTDAPSHALHLGHDKRVLAIGGADNGNAEWPQDKPVVRVRAVPGGREVTWLAPARLFSRQPSRDQLTPLLQADGALQFDVTPVQAPTSAVTLAMECGDGPCKGKIDLAPTLRKAAAGRKRTLTVPLKCFASGTGAVLPNVEVPFGIEADAPFAATFGNVRIVPGAAKTEDAVDCNAARG